jgi:hypothetical protein
MLWSMSSVLYDENLSNKVQSSIDALLGGKHMHMALTPPSAAFEV